MKNTKRVITVFAAVTCVAVLSLGVCASSHTTTLGTSNGSLVYNTTDSEVVNVGSHTCHYRVSSFRFHGGMPENTFPAGKSFTVRFANIGISKKYTSVDTNYKSKSYSVSSQKTVYAGVESNATQGVTVYSSWDPNW
ncbi:MAG: hypothetical protein J6X33_01805 [Clostridiales bacterium]|nr:hypothetical protein [Clostridiales bacterium]